MHMTQARPRRVRGIITGAIASTALLLGSLGLAAAPATAVGEDGTASFSVAATGVVGVPQNVAYSLYTGSFVPTAITVTGSASATPVTIPITADSGTFQWIPPHVGTWTFSSQSLTGTASTFINQVGTVTTVTSPNTAKVGVPVTITATVVANSGSQLRPLGTIQFATVGGGNLGAPVWLNGGNPSSASISWTPAVLGTTRFTATYTPFTINGVTDTTCGTTCTSVADSTQVTTSGTNIYLANAPQMFAGTPVTLTAVVSVVPPTGTVTFVVNGSVIAANVPVAANGIASTLWTPPTAGQFTLVANWLANNGVSGQAQETLVVGGGAPQGDSIIVIPTGGAPLAPGGSSTQPNGTVVTFTATTASGAAVTFTESGPCSISGGTFTVSQGSGQCRITATTPGGNGYSANSATYTVNLVPGQQTAVLAAPASGRINVGRTLRLETAAQGDTNAGQNINWRITQGRNSVCALRFPSSGAVTLRILKRGQCTVVGRAPAVAGQWSAFSTSRNYRGV